MARLGAVYPVQRRKPQRSKRSGSDCTGPGLNVEQGKHAGQYDSFSLVFNIGVNNLNNNIYTRYIKNRIQTQNVQQAAREEQKSS